MKLRILTSVILITILGTCFAQKEKQKLIAKKWKLIRELDNGNEVTPKHDKLVLEFKKNGTFTITAAFEETHSGTWKLSGDQLKVELTDEETNEERILFIQKLDKHHFTVGNFDGPSTAIEMVPLGRSKSQHLTHTEHMVAKKWHVYESDNPDNLGALFEFKPDKTFIIVPYGYKIPVFTGQWSLSEDNKTLLVDRREDDQHMELDIVGLETHDMKLQNHETKKINAFHDRRIVPDSPNSQTIEDN